MTTHYRLPAADGDGVKLLGYENEVFMDLEGADPARALEFAYTFPHKPGDILLTAHPKCGSHWMSTVLWKLKTLTDYKRPKITVLEFEEKEGYAMQEAPRILQSHLRPSRLPKEHLANDAKIVFVVRNPKDTCVSFYHHLKDAIAIKNGQTLNEFFESYFKGEMWYASIVDYLKDWEDFIYERTQENRSSNILILYYEDLKMNPMDNLKRLNTFLDFNRDQAYLDQVLEHMSFESMKNKELQNKATIHPFCVNNDGNSVIYRQGKIGDWKNYLTVAQSERVDVLMKQKLTRGIFNIPFY